MLVRGPSSSLFFRPNATVAFFLHTAVLAAVICFRFTDSFAQRRVLNAVAKLNRSWPFSPLGTSWTERAVVHLHVVHGVL